MIKIEEKDTLWHFYKKYYSYNDMPVKAPVDLCSYFWSAVLGAIYSFFWEAHFLLVSAFYGAMAYGLFYLFGIMLLSNNRYLYPLLPITALASIACMIAAIIVPFCRWFRYWNEKNLNVSMWSGIILTTVGLSLVASMLFVNKEDGYKWDWWYLFYGTSAVLTAYAVSAFLMFFAVMCDTSTNLGRNIWQYLGAIKNRVCPLVDPPDSFKEKEKEKMMYTDS